MAEGGGFNFNQWAQMNLGQQGGGEDAKPNEDDVFKLAEVGANKIAPTAAKLLEAIPLIGSFLAGLIPTNAGQVSLLGSVETQGLAGKTINPGKGGAQGGVLASIASALVKNSAISDHTTGVGGSNADGGGSGNADSGGGGGGGGSQSSDSYAANSGIADMVIAAGGGNNFVAMNVDWGDLGSLRPSFTPNMGQGQGAGMDIG